MRGRVLKVRLVKRGRSTGKRGIRIDAKELASVPMFLRAGRSMGTIVSIYALPLSPGGLTIAELQPKLGLLARREPLRLMAMLG